MKGGAGENFSQKFSPAISGDGIYTSEVPREGDFDARHRKQGRGGMSVFTYVIANETRSFRSIAQNIRERLATEILVSDVRSEREQEGVYFHT